MISALSAPAETIVVNTSIDYVDFGGNRMVSDLPGPDGVVSLAEAVMAANHSPGADRIIFNIPTTDPNYNYSWAPGEFVLFVESSAPLELTDDETTIDGTTQSAFTGDTAAGPEIHLRTTPPWANAPGIMVNSDNNTIRGLGGFSLFQYGIEINGNGNRVVANSIVQAGSAGIRITGANNQIGGSGTEGNRVISSGTGIWLSGAGATGNSVEGNTITLSWTYGVSIDEGASKNTIGGAGEARNIIFRSGHLSSEQFPAGSSIQIRADNNIISGNQIGLDETGEANAGSVWSGIELWGSSNLVERNIISGHAGFYKRLTARPAGVRLTGGKSNVVKGNLIGTDASGKMPAGNGYGIKVDVLLFANVPVNHTIGGTNAGDGNVIAYSQHDGIAVGGTASGIRIVGNSIFGNAELGINLGIELATESYPDSVTANDSGDDDSGANGLQNFPVITSAVSNGGGTEVSGTLDTPGAHSVRIELFVNDERDLSGFGEGQIFAGATYPEAGGRWSAVLPVEATGKFITATATDVAGNTSEFSEAVQVTGSSRMPPVLEPVEREVVKDQFAFDLVGSTGTDVVVETSTDLASWTPVSTNRIEATHFRFEDSVPPRSQRFYRARIRD